MSVQKPTPIEVAAKSISEQQMQFHIRAFNDAPIRGYLLLLLSKEINKERQNLDDVSEKELKKLQGKIAGLKWLHTIVEANFENQPKKNENI